MAVDHDAMGCFRDNLPLRVLDSSADGNPSHADLSRAIFLRPGNVSRTGIQDVPATRQQDATEYVSVSRSKIKRHRITIQEPIETQDSNGQPVVVWQNFRTNEPADFMPTGGMEVMRGRQLESGTKGVFRVNYRTGYTTQQRVVFNDINYGISHVNQVDGLRYEIELMVKT